MIEMRQWFRQRRARQAFVMLGVLALLLGTLPRWHLHDHGSHDWSGHHAHHHDSSRGASGEARGDPGSATDGLHIHELAAAFCGLLPDEAPRLLELRRAAFGRPVHFASPPDDHPPPLIRPPIA